ncbi:prion-inhibition and propagation-domain-containing protein [Massariosphaeria phaeospora]|uniref:Prion-inhibition and propagation-domain-containing protein n=1 Tax=Massariosphaeria phaeospora TaxID=100035 RepID=A0A7C8IBU5_9PLEO|nr:prion-inhibition and propagation-domain-containing protein [Massariosphaeria phaeospora]
MSDPLSVAGLAIGAASLTVQIFDGCLKGYSYFESAVNMTAECETLKIRIMMEYSRLQQWGHATGLTDEGRHSEYNRKMRVNAALVEAIMSEVRSELKRMSAVSLLVIKDEERGVQTNTEGTENSASLGKGADITSASSLNLSVARTKFSMVSIESEKRQYPKGFNGIMGLVKGVRTVATNPKRMKWALQDKKKVEISLVRLKELTNFLHETVDDNQRQALYETANETWMAMLQMKDTVEGMQKLLEAMAADKEVSMSPKQADFDSQGTTLTGSANASHGARQDLKSSQALYERLTWFSIVAAKELDGPNRPENHLDRGEIQGLQPEDHKSGVYRTVASFRGRRVWIEWKRYEETLLHLDKGETKTGPDNRTLKNIERLVSLLRLRNRPVEFCVPVCHGYFMIEGKHSSFGIVYEFDEKDGITSAPRSLLDLLGDRKPPPLIVRMLLAQDLASSLMYLHAVNWLHKGVRSSNILFADSPNGDLGGRYISGLEYARPDEAGLTNKTPAGDLAHGEYVHPDYLGSGQQTSYRKTYDIYSLGIVLLEIAYWKPAKEIMDLTPGKRARSIVNLREVRRRLLESEPGILEHVRSTMGDRYLSVLRACLVGMDAFGLHDGLPQSDPAIAALLQQAYLRIVVDVLKSILV